MSKKDPEDHHQEPKRLLEFAALLLLSATELLQYAALHFLSDKSLMYKLKAGQSDALTVLFKRHYNFISQFASRLLRSPAIATTLTHEVFTDLYHLRETFDPEKIKVKTWLVAQALRRIAGYHSSEAATIERYAAQDP